MTTGTKTQDELDANEYTIKEQQRAFRLLSDKDVKHRLGKRVAKWVNDYSPPK